MIDQLEEENRTRQDFESIRQLARFRFSTSSSSLEEAFRQDMFRSESRRAQKVQSIELRKNRLGSNDFRGNFVEHSSQLDVFETVDRRREKTQLVGTGWN